MAGSKSTATNLNKSLYYICSLLLKNLPKNSWFIGYGTLLGMVRSGSCIDGDDDISSTFVANKGLLDGSGVLTPATTVTQKVTDWTTNGYWSPYTSGAAKVTHLSQQILSDSSPIS